jgi:hypothetical protein
VTVRFVPLDAMGEFKPGRLDQIVGWLEEALPDVAAPLRADRVDVVVVPSSHPVPGWDVNGYANGTARITIGIDPACDGREKAPLPEQLKSTLSHELHHVIRWRGPGYGLSLGEALVSEGLAQCFEEEVGLPTPNYAVAVQGPTLKHLGQLARSVWSADYDHARWFYGERTDPAWPWGGGYSLGYAIVRHVLDVEILTASAAVHRAAETFRYALDQLFPLPEPAPSPDTA